MNTKSLNFVNNFSHCSNELIKEIKEAPRMKSEMKF